MKDEFREVKYMDNTMRNLCKYCKYPNCDKTKECPLVFKESQKIINQLEKKLSRMTDEERHKYFDDMGFVDVRRLK